VSKGSIPTGRVARAVAIGSATAASAGARAVNRLRRGEGLEEREIAMLVKEAERYAELLGGMKGAAMKLGQLISFLDADLVPEAYRPLYHQALAVLQADAPPLPFEAVAAVFKEELGRPVAEVFEWFAPVPMAAASIGQVHAAHLHGGREVAVKIQYPGAADAVAADLANADLLAQVAKMGMRMLGPLRPSVNVRALVDEVIERVSEELDYRIEARNQSEFAERFAGHPTIRVPAVVAELSTERVLVSEYDDGMRWSAAVEAPAPLRNQWGEAISRFLLEALYRHGLFNADPHPGNYLFHEDGTVTFLDFGCVTRFRPETIAGIRAVIAATLAGDADDLRRQFVDLGILAERSKLTASRLFDWYAVGMEPLMAPQPFTYNSEFAARVVATCYDGLGQWSDVLLELQLPAEFTFLNRIMLGFNSVLAGLGATSDWASLNSEVRNAGS
jgi:predicted unusual protein kinase regulating ubiquinone biosynthesis (AarF/ABC1/UbiB family)